LGRLRTAWPWLAEARVPGPDTPTVTPPDRREHIQHVRAEQAAKDRRAKQLALSGGTGPDAAVNPAARGIPTVPPGAHPDAARADPIAARAEIADTIARLADRLWVALEAPEGDRSITWPVVGAGRVHTTADCRTCHGTGATPKPRWWPPGQPWPPDDGEAPPCRHCRGGSVRHTHYLDHADILMSVALGLLKDLLPRVNDPDRAADALRALDRCDRTARRAARAGEHRIHIKAPCPACGARDLWAETSSPNREEWTVRCEYLDCSCRGPGCPCNRPVRWRGRRHMWPAEEWDGPRGLAAVIGVGLPELDQPEKPRLRASREGKGGKA
jgi:hypothetical protein